MFNEKYHCKRGTHCWYCDREYMNKRSIYAPYPKPSLERTKDHIVPVSKGGPNNIGNYVGCCSDCNFLKGNMDAYKFAKWLTKQIESNAKHELQHLFPIMKIRSWKAYNKTSKIHLKTSRKHTL